MRKNIKMIKLSKTSDYPEIFEFLSSVFMIIEIRASVGKENGIAFEVRTNEKNHTISHVHARYGEYNISIAIETGEVLAGNLPKKQSKLAQQWVASNQDKLKSDWSNIAISSISHMTMTGLSSVDN